MKKKTETERDKERERERERDPYPPISFLAMLQDSNKTSEDYRKDGIYLINDSSFNLTLEQKNQCVIKDPRRRSHGG
jgi:hypothetical protein